MGGKFPIKGRYIVAIWLLPFLPLFDAGILYQYIDLDRQWYWLDIIYYYYYHFFVSVLLVTLVLWSKIHWRLMFSKPMSVDYYPAIKLTIYIFIFSIAAAYALFYPLSFLVPEFVNSWYINVPPLVYYYEGVYPFLPNILSFVSLVILAPIIEEFTFRGLLLHRWGEKWGMLKAMMLSSFLFGILHQDPIGAMAFGLAMSVLYLKTQTLLIPILCHGFNNFVVWLISVGYIVWLGPDYVYTLEDFQSEWSIGVAAGVVVAIWGYSYLKGRQSNKAWRLPKLY